MRPPLPRQIQPPSPAMTSHSPSSTTDACKRSKTRREEALNPSFADLPSSLVEVIMSRLVLKDNIRASVACKPWREAAVYVRVVEKHPWLLCFPKSGSLFKLCDPLQWKSHTMKLPELDKSTVCYSRDGCLPKFHLSFQNIAFSCPPTSDGCVVLAIKFVVSLVGDPATVVTVSTCYPGATEWITEDFDALFRGVRMQSKIVYLNDRFYCFSARGGLLYSFQPSSRKWRLHPSAYINPQKHWDGYEKGVFMAEKKGELFLMFTSGNEKPMVYKLASLKWQEMSSTDLDGLTFFASFHNSEVRSDLPWMRNNVYFSRFGNNRKRTSYSFDESKYSLPKKWENWEELCPPQTLWIDPPKNVLEYL